MLRRRGLWNGTETIATPPDRRTRTASRKGGLRTLREVLDDAEAHVCGNGCIRDRQREYIPRNEREVTADGFRSSQGAGREVDPDAPVAELAESANIEAEPAPGLHDEPVSRKPSPEEPGGRTETSSRSKSVPKFLIRELAPGMVPEIRRSPAAVESEPSVLVHVCDGGFGTLDLLALPGFHGPVLDVPGAAVYPRGSRARGVRICSRIDPRNRHSAAGPARRVASFGAPRRALGGAVP